MERIELTQPSAPAARATAPGIDAELARGKFTDEMLAEMRALIGTELRTDACVNNEYATRLAILRFAEGIGDGNPLWTDPDYAAGTSYGGLIAPPSFIFACLGSIQVGWRGLGGFHAETRLTFHRPIRVGDRVDAKVYFDGFDGPDPSQFAGRRIKDYLRQEYRNQDDELVATFICSRMRFERTEAQSRASPARSRYRTRGPTPRSKQSRTMCWPRSPAERCHGTGTTSRSATIWTSSPRGQSASPTRSPSSPRARPPFPRLSAHGVSLRRYRKHPKWAFRDPTTHALEPVYSVHYNDYAARLQGAQAAYDVGIQRTCWQIHSLDQLDGR